MASSDELVAWLDEELDVAHFNDAEGAKFNGALVAGADEVSRLGLCCNCTFETIAEAAEQDCDMVVSHHGGWEAFDGDLLAEKKERMRDAGLTWYIAHEPLDCADDYGVSAALAAKLDIRVEGSYGFHAGGEVGRYGTFDGSTKEFRERVSAIDDAEVVGDLAIEGVRIGVIGGSAGVFTPLLDATVEEGCDVLVTGNASFFGKYHARERGLTLVLLEETSSERWGVYALGEEVQRAFSGTELVRLDETNW